MVSSTLNYYPFGMPMPGRAYTSGSGYRYGFNGKENDNEVKGDGNQQDYGFRIYDPRLGKFLSEDPITKEYPWYTPYQFAGNNPIQYIDLDGLEPAETRGNGKRFVNISARDGQLQTQIKVPNKKDIKPQSHPSLISRAFSWLKNKIPNVVGYNMPEGGGTRVPDPINPEAPTIYADGQIMKDLQELLPLADFKGGKPQSYEQSRKNTNDGGRTYSDNNQEQMMEKTQGTFQNAQEMKEIASEKSSSKYVTCRNASCYGDTMPLEKAGGHFPKDTLTKDGNGKYKKAK